MNTITSLWTSPPLLSVMPTNDMMALKGSATSIDCVLRDTANKILMNNLVKGVHLEIRCSNMSHKNCKGRDVRRLLCWPVMLSSLQYLLGPCHFLGTI